ncbi:hypothetical protein GL272_01075 [Aeromonas veronii]|uniref:nucleoid-associated protein n=1 Tax=Aeromonas veronii TaxID=654 RepID=UPI001C5A9A86|nr:nucleoid-associated protein [Aeromonas veronii]MBW3775546.1 hypothetical protein [Aeromonas veronii]
MEVLKLTIHELVKESSKRKEQKKKIVIPRNNYGSLLDVTNENSKRLLQELNKIYGKKDSSATYGTFSREQLSDGEVSSNPFPSNIDSYIKDDKYEDTTFYEMTKIAMKQLLQEAKTQEFATGGYVVFSHYKIETFNFILIAMIKGTEGLNITSKLEIERIDEIDLSKIHQAARINITELRSYVSPIKNPDALSKAYLSFISPRSNSSVSGYFVKALDCLDTITSEKSTTTAFACVREYLKQSPDLRKYRPEAKDAIIKYFDECLLARRQATLEGIEHSVRGVIPAEHHALMDDFFTFANSEKYQLPAEFHINKKKLELESKIKVITPQWELKFDAQLVSEDTSSDLIYNKDKKTLTLRCNEELITKIEGVLFERKIK